MITHQYSYLPNKEGCPYQPSTPLKEVFMKDTLYEQIREFGTKTSFGIYYEVYKYKDSEVFIMFVDKEHKMIERIVFE